MSAIFCVVCALIPKSSAKVCGLLLSLLMALCLVSPALELARGLGAQVELRLDFEQSMELYGEETYERQVMETAREALERDAQELCAGMGIVGARVSAGLEGDGEKAWVSYMRVSAADMGGRQRALEDALIERYRPEILEIFSEVEDEGG